MLTLELSDGVTTLDLMGTTYRLVRWTLDLGDPQEIVAEASNLFRDGWDLMVHGFGKRTISMQLNVTGTDQAALGAAISELGDVLRKARNYQTKGIGSRWRLRVNLGGASRDVYFSVQNGSFAVSPRGLASLLLTDSKPYILQAPLRLDVDTFGEGAEEIIENYFDNASFEVAGTPLADWVETITAVGNTSRDTTQHKYGLASCKFVMTGAGAGGQVISRRQDIAAAPGDVWSWGAWLYFPALLDSYFLIRAWWLDAAFGAIGGTMDIHTYTTNTDFEKKERENATAPALTAWLRIECNLRAIDAGATGTAYVDGCIAVKAAALPDAWASGRSIANHYDDNGQAHLNYIDVEDVGGDYPAKVQFKVTENEAHTKVWAGARHADRQYDGGIFHEGEDFDTWSSEPASGAASGGAYGRWASGLSWQVRNNSSTIGAADIEFAHNPGALANGFLIVGVSAERAAGGQAPNSVTHNAKALTKVMDVTNGTINVSIWYRVAPDAAGQVYASFPANQDGIVAGAVSYADVHQTAPLGTAKSATGASGTAVVSDIVAATVDTVFAVAVREGTGTGVHGGDLDNEHWDASAGAVCQGLGGDAMDVPTNVTAQWSGFVGISWAIIGVAIKPLNAAAPKVFTKSVAVPPVGAYRVLARLHGNGGGYGAAMGYAYGGVTSDPSFSSQYAAIPTTTNRWHLLDIGSIIVPPSALPSGATIGTLTLRLCIYRTSGSTGTNLDVDWVMLLPVDFGSAYAAKASGTDVVVLDTISKPPQLALWDGADVFQSRPEQEGVPPTIDPDGTRIYFAFDDDVDATITDGATIETRIIPRWMTVA